eukprot:6492451-Prymnesium_polylepis.1
MRPCWLSNYVRHALHVSAIVLLLDLAAATPVGVAPATVLDERPTGLVAFTLVRGGPTERDFLSFINSRRCLQDAMPSWLRYANVAFHEGNVPSQMQHALRLRV